MSDLQMYRGDTQTWNLSALRDGVAIDLTGAKVWFTAKRSPNGARVFQRTSEAGEGIVIDADQVVNRGKAVITLQSADTSALPTETIVLVYDVQVKSGSNIWTIDAGNLTVLPDATTEIV